MLTAKVDVSGALARLGALRSESPKAIMRALNKTAITARMKAAQQIQQAGYQIKASDLKKNISIRRASTNELNAAIRAIGKPIPLIRYGARATKSGVTVAVKNGRKLIEGAFIATMPNGHRGVYLRVGQQHKVVVRNGKKMRTGLPIRQLFGPSVPQAMANEVVQAAVMEAIEERFPVVLAQELHYLTTLH